MTADEQVALEVSGVPGVSSVPDGVGDPKSFRSLCSSTLRAARRIAGAHGATFVLRDGAQCFYVDEDAAAALWKGQRFPITECISGWAMLHAAPAEVPDIRLDPRIPQAAYAPTFVRSLAMVPMGTDEPRGAIGVYWDRAGRRLPPGALDELMALAASAGDAVGRLGLHNAPWAPTFSRRDTAC